MLKEKQDKILRRQTDFANLDSTVGSEWGRRVPCPYRPNSQAERRKRHRERDMRKQDAS